jgi:hypothetical protein
VGVRERALFGGVYGGEELVARYIVIEQVLGRYSDESFGCLSEKVSVAYRGRSKSSSSSIFGDGGDCSGSQHCLLNQEAREPDGMYGSIENKTHYTLHK